jgi:predicted  nucleic acid-binding Zn-ribbon protein
MSITPTPPQPEESVYETSSTPRWVLIVVIVLFLGFGGAVYAGYKAQGDLTNELATANQRSDQLMKELDQTNARIADVRAQLAVTSQKLGLTQDELARARTLAQQIQKQQQDADAQLGEQIGQVRQANQESQQKIGQVATDLTGAKTDIAATQKDLADTKSKLTSAVGDLNGQGVLIARNREELEALKRLNERNIYDFKLVKSKTPQRVGPIQINLRSTDPKRFRFTMTVIADDKSIEKKDRNVDEPMQFYVRGARAPYEIVVFEVAKDQATGYLSAPKDTATASASPASAPAKQ